MRAMTVLRVFVLLLLAFAASSRAEVERLTILHLNDLHARLLPDERGMGGFAHVATAIRSERAKAENPIVLHAGDMVQGSPVSTIFEGLPVFEVANTLGIDAHCLGNHEFDYGWERIKDFERAAAAPILAANVVDGQGRRLVGAAAVLAAGNLKVGVVGALTPMLPHLLKPGQMGPWTAARLVAGLRDTVREMERRADLVVVLGHLFDDEDELVLRELPDVDVLVGGHDHGGRDVELVIDGRIGVKLRPYGRELGRLEIEFDTAADRIVDYSWSRIPIYSDRYSAHAETEELVRHWEAKVSEKVDVQIGFCDRPLGRSAVQALVERAMLDATGADIAYMNRGGVRDSLGRGPVMARHVWNILPFDNSIVEATVLGSELPEEATGGRRVQPDRRYRFVTNDYVAGLSRYRNIHFRPTGEVLRDLMLDWVAARERVP